MAKLYGCLPSALLHLTPFEFDLNHAIADLGTKEDQRDHERAARRR